MWRLPGSKHQQTGLYKTLLNPCGNDQLIYSDQESIIKYSSSPQALEVINQTFAYTANEWYRENIYEMEEDEKRKDNPLEYFIKNCSAVARLKKQAEEEHFLEHEARLFLCSILTYTEDSIKFLHDILSNCSDYSFDKSSAHINDWVKRRQMGTGGRPFTCDRANAVGAGCGECKLERKNKWAQIGNKYVETTEKSSPSPIRYAYKSIKKEENNGNKKSR